MNTTQSSDLKVNARNISSRNTIQKVNIDIKNN